MTRSRESIRSRIPPCPGIMLPESLMLRLRFISDSRRSPQVEKIVTVVPKSSQVPTDQPVPQKWVPPIAKSHPAIRLKASPPKKPSHDFFGEMRSNSLFFPIVHPTRKAPVSLIHIIRKMARTRCNPPFRAIAVMHKKGRPIYSCEDKERVRHFIGSEF